MANVAPPLRGDYGTHEAYILAYALWQRVGGAASNIAPNSATYITQTAHADLSAEQALSSLSTGFMKVANGTGIISSTGNSTIQTADIADDQVTYAKIQNISATDKILGRSTAGAGDTEEIDCTAAGRALLDDASASAQRTTLGLGTIATQDANNVSISGGSLSGISITSGSITGITDLAVADGGTGSSTASAARTALGFADGTYTPTLTNGTNVAASQTYQAQYMRVGNTVTVSGSVDVNKTAAAATLLGISLPIASDFGNDYECAGTCNASATVSESAAIRADTTNNRAEMVWVSSTTNNHKYYYTFTYLVI